MQVQERFLSKTLAFAISTLESTHTSLNRDKFVTQIQPMVLGLA
jgi:hypothetical protein